MITHKFREVMAFADEVTILRRGKLAGKGLVKELTPDAMARAMIGAEELTIQPPRSGEAGSVRLELEQGLRARRRRRDCGEGCLALGARRRDRRHRRRLRQRPAPARRGARRSARGRKRRNPRRGRRLSRQPRGDAPAQDVAVAGRAAEKRLRRRHERRRQRGVPRIRPRARSPRAAGGSTAPHSAATPNARSASTRSRPAAPIRRSRRCPAAMCSARYWRANSAAMSRC